MVAHSFYRLYNHLSYPYGLGIVDKPVNAAVSSFPALIVFRLWSGQFSPRQVWVFLCEELSDNLAWLFSLFSFLWLWCSDSIWESFLFTCSYYNSYKHLFLSCILFIQAYSIHSVNRPVRALVYSYNGVLRFQKSTHCILKILNN